MLLRLDSGGTTERVQERFGFRKIENRNGVLLWNGVPIKCTGTCRHEEFSPYGHALTEECWKTDIALMKAANINAIRTSHYNHSARFLELCDEAGFYVLDEVPFCWVADDPSRQPEKHQRGVGLHSALQGNTGARQEPPLRHGLEHRQRKRLRSQRPIRV